MLRFQCYTNLGSIGLYQTQSNFAIQSYTSHQRYERFSQFYRRRGNEEQMVTLRRRQTCYIIIILEHKHKGIGWNQFAIVFKCVAAAYIIDGSDPGAQRA